jgi:hypothetical protein
MGAAMITQTQCLTNAAECERLSIVRGTRQQLGGRRFLRSGLFSAEECAARRECKVQPAIRPHYADGGQHQIYDASPGQFAPVIAHDSPLFPVLTFEGLCGGIRAARLISPQCGVAATPNHGLYGLDCHRRRGISEAPSRPLNRPRFVGGHLSGQRCWLLRWSWLGTAGHSGPTNRKSKTVLVDLIS